MTIRILATLFTSLFFGQSAAQPIPVRNDVPRMGQQEIVMMRHAYLDDGGYQHWYEQSSSKVWPWFERLGARIIGDFEIIYPDGEDLTPRQDEALRFARYASYEHWQATRPVTAVSSGDTGGSVSLAGNGPLLDENISGLNSRREVSQGSRGGFFLQGYMAQNNPIYMPGLVEDYAETAEPRNTEAESVAVRLGPARARGEVLTLHYRRIKKDSFEEIHAVSRGQVWPYAEKVGVRPVGQWKVLYLPNSSAEESADYDEVYTLLRYSSYEHFLTFRDDPISLGGNGPDFEQMLDGINLVDQFTGFQSVEFLRGPLWGAKPHYTPNTGETFELIN